MNRRQVATSMVAGGAVLVLGQRPAGHSTALAGGWASLELINPVQVVVVGVPAVVDAQMLRHGVHPIAGLSGAIQFLDEETGDEQIVQMEVISDAFAIVRGEVTLNQPGTYRMQTSQMGPEIELGHVEAISPTSGDVISGLHTAPDSSLACSGGEISDALETEILHGSYAEPLLDVAAGTTVRWVNTSAIPHTVTFQDRKFGGSALLRQDKTFSMTFAEPGTYDYYCAPHPYMTGAVRVGHLDA